MDPDLFKKGECTKSDAAVLKKVGIWKGEKEGERPSYCAPAIWMRAIRF